MGGGNCIGKSSGPAVDHTDVLVLAGRSEDVALVVPGKVLSELGVSLKGRDGLSLLNVPNLHRVVSRARGKHVSNSGVEFYQSDLEWGCFGGKECVYFC